MFRVLMIISLLYSSIMVGSAPLNSPQEKEFTLERITRMLNCGAIQTELRLRNNKTQDLVIRDKLYIPEPSQNGINYKSSSFGGTSIIRSSDDKRETVGQLLPGVVQHCLKGNTRPNCSMAFDLDEIPQELRRVEEGILLNDNHIAEFIQEHVASLARQQRCAWLRKTVQECLTQ